MAPGQFGREEAFGQTGALSPVDRLGIWLSARRVRKSAGSLAGRRIGDIGCGYHATLVRQLLPSVASAVVVDLALAPDLLTKQRVTAHEGHLPEVLDSVPDASLDVTLCISVLEHLWEPEVVLRHLRRITAPGGVVLINVPSWRGKFFLELSAFRFSLSPAEEMQDHKAYYDPRDLWPLLIRAGFLPREVACRRYKFGLNTFAVCRVSEGSHRG